VTGQVTKLVILKVAGQNEKVTTAKRALYAEAVGTMQHLEVGYRESKQAGVQGGKAGFCHAVLNAKKQVVTKKAICNPRGWATGIQSRGECGQKKQGLSCSAGLKKGKVHQLQ